VLWNHRSVVVQGTTRQLAILGEDLQGIGWGVQSVLERLGLRYLSWRQAPHSREAGIRGQVRQLPFQALGGLLLCCVRRPVPVTNGQIDYLVQDLAFDGVVKVVVDRNESFTSIIIRAGRHNGEAHIVEGEAEHERREGMPDICCPRISRPGVVGI
jgi:hypothetical protein